MSLALTPAEHETSEAVTLAAQWLVSTPQASRGGRAVPQLKARFGLTAVEATAAIREANLQSTKSI